MARATLQVTSAPAVCCSPVVGAPLDVAAADQLATVLKALAEPTRLRLLSLVAAHADGEACICDLTEPVGLSQPTVSHHMKVLVEAGLLSRDQRGKWAYYRLIPEAMHSLAEALVPREPVRLAQTVGTTDDRPLRRRDYGTHAPGT